MAKKIFILVIGIFIFSCGDNDFKYTVPRAPVDFKVQLNGADNALNSFWGHKRYDKEGNYGYNQYVGYSGLLVFCYGFDESGFPELNAFDLCCPYEDLVSVRVVANNEGKATCTGCKSVYDLTSGFPDSGPSKERLQMYPVTRQLPYSGVYYIHN